MRTRFSLVMLVFGFTALAPMALADDSHCDPEVGERDPTTPTGEFDFRNETTLHSPTGLQWSRCAVGQQFDGTSCTGSAQVFSWDDARQVVTEVNQSRSLAGYSDWRLPTVDELLTIVEKCREAPSINTNAFPATPWTGFWTSTPHGDADGEYNGEEVPHVDHEAPRGSHNNEDEDDEIGPEAWFVGFYYGMEYPYSTDSGYRVRLVRNG